MRNITLRRLRLVFVSLVVIAQFAVMAEMVNLSGIEPVLADASANNNLIISAVQITGGANHTQEDFVELYNPTENPIDLKGYRLVKRTATGTTDSLIKSWTSTAVVPGHHFYLWANSIFSGISVGPDAVSTATIADNNGIALRFGNNDTGTIIDSIAWGNTVNGFDSSGLDNPGPSQSITRTSLFSTVKTFAVSNSAPRNLTNEILPSDIPVSNPTSAVTQTPVSEPNTVVDATPVSIPAPIEQQPIISPAPTPSVDPAPVSQPAPVPEVDQPAESQPNLVITELLPNPAGSDSGHEQVEVYNSGPQPINLSGYILDDVNPTDTITSNAYTLPELEVASDGYAAVTIPSGSFAMNNTGGDVVTLFSAEKEPIDTASYQDSAPEQKSYSDFPQDWQWTEPTLGSDNGIPPVNEVGTPQNTSTQTPTTVEDTPKEATPKVSYDESGLQISEIYPDPERGSSEFLEIYNSGEEKADLSAVTLSVGEKHKPLGTQVLEPGKFYVIESALPAQLRNAGQIIKLVESNRVIDSVRYPQSVKGSSYSRFEDGFQWTLQVTKGSANHLKLPDQVVKVAKDQQVEAEKAVVEVKQKATKATLKTSIAKTIAKATSKLKSNPVKSVATKVDSKVSTTKNDPKTSSSSKSTDTQPQEALHVNPKKDSISKVLAMGAAAVAAGVAALYKLVFAGRIG